MAIFRKFKKLIYLLVRRKYIKYLLYKVAPAIEHESILRTLKINTLFDAGANKGQFSSLVRVLYPNSNIFAFEPLAGPAYKYQQIFKNDKNVFLNEFALGESSGTELIHISKREDSSSMLAITECQTSNFPGTQEIKTIPISIRSLDEIYLNLSFSGPSLLKIDVQGYELKVLKGARNLLRKIDWVYCECSFQELYRGQPLAGDIIYWLKNNSFELNGIYNAHYNNEGVAIQADLLFKNTFDDIQNINQ